MSSPTPTVLILEDDPLVARVLAAILRHRFRVEAIEDPLLLEQTLRGNEVDLLLLDLGLPAINGEALLPSLARERPDLPVIVVSGASDVATAMRMVRMGAFDFLTKPVEPAALISAVDRAIAFRQANRPQGSVGLPAGIFDRIVTASPLMLELFRYVVSVAPSPGAVLITGETGTGKELVARAVHDASGRSGAFVTCNTGGVDDTLFTDALFGHVKGAFTGAIADRQGLVERAVGGTLFLDEIGDLSVPSQIKLLRLLQESEYLPVGVDLPRRASVRIIAATSVDLEGRLADGRFRRDLYYRLCGHRVHLPPLRDRPTDIPLLLAHFTAMAAAQLGLSAPRVPPAVIDLCMPYPFPGNVRELQGLVQDALSRSGGRTLEVESFRALQAAPALPVAQLTFPARLPQIQEVVDQLVAEALRRSQGNRAAAARLLGISRQAMSQRLRHRDGNRS